MGALVPRRQAPRPHLHALRRRLLLHRVPRSPAGSAEAQSQALIENHDRSFLGALNMNHTSVRAPEPDSIVFVVLNFVSDVLPTSVRNVMYVESHYLGRSAAGE